jgi:hypothetical protein
MSIKRYGAEQAGPGGKTLPFARAVEADGWLHVSGQVAMENGEVIDGNIVVQTHKTIGNVLAILTTCTASLAFPSLHDTHTSHAAGGASRATATQAATDVERVVTMGRVSTPPRHGP